MILLTSEDASLMDRWAVAVGGRGTLIRRVRLLAEAEGTLAGRRPDVMLLDLSLTDLSLSGAAGIAGLLSFSPQTRIIALSHQPNDEEGIAALRAGARGYCNAYIDPRLLAKAVTTVQNGEAWVGRRLTDRLVALVGQNAPLQVDTDGSIDLDLLTAREQQIALQIGMGSSNKLIAQRLGITERTVKAHLGSVFAKLGVHDRLQLALLVTGRMQYTSPTTPVC
ncbi:response regulator transcription factor [Immundisolibacter sp.]|jgi:DNA-binding NarL/FixJ family response regulator|uniref:response regulator transcription factor n=1 Tax=Immundisolibacter sp. TaxID=1934948 RepID=UPI002B17D266|nr:response regulator transcription factor [Immundisolibacter sp.]MEA3220561.1 HTH-type transcriptional regulator MalT [Immundisolibacter sp.]